MCNLKKFFVQTLHMKRVIEPVIDDFIHPLSWLQTVGQYHLLRRKFIPTLCRNTMDAKLPLTCLPSNGALRKAKREIGDMSAHADVYKDHRTSNRVLRSLLSEREEEARCELCVLQGVQRIILARELTERYECEDPLPGINELLPSITDGEGADPSRVYRNE